MSWQTHNCLTSISECFTVTALVLQHLSESRPNAHSLSEISCILRSLGAIAQTAESKGNECRDLLEETHVLSYAILKLMSPGALAFPPETSNHINEFIITLKKIHSFVARPQDTASSTIEHSLHQNLLRDCRVGLQEAAAAFKPTKTCCNLPPPFPVHPRPSLHLNIA
ncbi:hypothetical protein GGX14DRAFT_95337 [Mycena pura]|uniref:Uncharacterized protein n=1 Tax=Mycena pura TaxID=153505 RepID=A0AAD6VEG6_9AGAR|nr:hypothetical protein GGX14DRAFT_95337 [Mycena pura]